jgi:hypothetical protein
MPEAALSSEDLKVLGEILGYLNFSEGASDARVLANLNCIYRRAAEAPTGDAPLWQQVRFLLTQQLDTLAAESSTFRDSTQARAVLDLAFEHVIPGYLKFHRDLLAHQNDDLVFGPFMLGRVFEAILLQERPWDDVQQVTRGAITTLGDFIGYRPIAVLETQRKIAPYPNEWVRPVPLYVRDAGVAAGRYEALIKETLRVLTSTDSDLLSASWFDLDALDELAFDPRAYDFDHPVNKRPNYHFGTWDLHDIDNRGRYRRFVIQQVTLDALMNRVNHVENIDRDEALVEAAMVLAGTILMASGTCGGGPGVHSSDVTLATLLPHIATYRDAFYVHHIEQIQDAHGKRLAAETEALQQPFAAARQHLNSQLARGRAMQLQHVHLARLYARMGHAEAAEKQIENVRVAGPRMLCRMEALLATGERLIDQAVGCCIASDQSPPVERQRELLREAAALLPETEDLLHRAIECGAMIDPWNILGFQGNISLFPALENSILDDRVDDLLGVVRSLVELHARLLREAALAKDNELGKQLVESMRTLAGWWDQFATTAVSDVEGIDAGEALGAAQGVAQVLSAWREGGSHTGDIAFWNEHVETLNSTNAYALVVETLLQRKDHLAAMALLMQWLSQADYVPLAKGGLSLCNLMLRWLAEVLRPPPGKSVGDESLELVCKFFDYLEANAEDNWNVPRLDYDAPIVHEEPALADDDGGESWPDDEDEDEDLFSAAYDQVIYRDSTSDGFDGSVLDEGQSSSEFGLEEDAQRVDRRLSFIVALARLWQRAAIAFGTVDDSGSKYDVFVNLWHGQAIELRSQLQVLLESVHNRPIRSPSGSLDSLVEYDRQRSIKISLLDKVIAATVEISDAARYLAASGQTDLEKTNNDPIVKLMRHFLRKDVDAARADWADAIASLGDKEILYVPLSRSGDPLKIVEVRCLQQSIRDLLAWMPRFGMLRETCQLIEVARVLESENTTGTGAVTEFDSLFEVGYKAIVESLVAASVDWNPTAEHPRETETLLVDCLQEWTEALLKRWLAHSRTLRLSVLERISTRKQWETVVNFIQHYGHDLFTQRFMTLGNIRAILLEGVGIWLAQLEEEGGEHFALLDDLGTRQQRAATIAKLELILEAVIENYDAYRDYNSTTTQSDRGEMLYTLLDFLRAKTAYERVAWNLRPVIWAHEVLVRSRREHAATLWEEAFEQRVREVADKHCQKLADLSRKYGMRLPTVSDRINERFLRPMAIDRTTALVRPSIEQGDDEEAQRAFESLRSQAQLLAEKPTGVGLETPDWIDALEEELERATNETRIGSETLHPCGGRPRNLTLAEVEDQLSNWELTDDDDE